jgi:hypothetical protein
VDEDRYSEQNWPPRPDNLAAWLRAGLRRGDALAWRRWNFDLDSALAWIRAGVPEALAAAQWLTAGVTPGSVADWCAAGIDAAEAVHWHELGFDLSAAREHKRHGRDPHQAYGQGRAGWFSPGSAPPEYPEGVSRLNDAMRQFLRAGIAGNLIGGYLQAQWVDPEALAWAEHGIAAQDATLWREVGLTPAEAAELATRGSSPAQVIRDWWRAGIPFDEVADWIGAGLDVRQASRRRAEGATGADAAELRARRRSDPPGC